MGYHIREACDRRTLKDFMELPWRIYRDDPLWVPPVLSELRRTLDTERNPYFRHATLKLFTCYRDGEPVSRVAVVVDRRFPEAFGVRSAMFGFFESTNDPEAARTLFAEAVRFCRSEGVVRLEGPFNPHHYAELGLQVSGFDTPVAFFQTHNPPYYGGLLEACGFREACRMVTSRNDAITPYVRNRYGEVSVAIPPGYAVRSLRKRDLSPELERMREVFNDAFAGNWHYLPVSREEYAFSAKFLNLVTDPELVTIVEHEGRPVGVLMCVLDVNPLVQQLNGRVGLLRYLWFLRRKKSIRGLIIYAVGIRKAYQRTRVFKLLLDAMCTIAVRFETLETTWMSPQNPLALRAAERMGMVPDKSFAIYERSV